MRWAFAVRFGRWRRILRGRRKGRGRIGIFYFRRCTNAGMSTLFITQDYVHSMEGLNCTGNVKDEHLERGLRWMSANFKKFEGGNPYYSLYGVERVGVASGYKFFGDQDWYQAGAEYLVKNQGEDGSWGGEDPHNNAKKIPNTGFGLLFLVRGRAPVLMNKLDYTADAT